MREIIKNPQFKADLKRIAKSGRYDVSELASVLQFLVNDILLPPRYQDHALAGNWKHHRECHVRFDWLLKYKLEPEILRLVRTGSHSDLF